MGVPLSDLALQQLRDEFARTALSGMMFQVHPAPAAYDAGRFAEAAYAVADAMMEIRDMDPISLDKPR